MAPQNRAGDDISIRRRRLAYRAAHRGTRELDLLLGPYTAARAGIMDAAELDALERLLDEADTTLQTWFLGQEEPPAHQQPLIQNILAFRQTST
jgi:antitoxin CptB